MPIHHVVSGECLTSLASRYRFNDCRDLYDHPQNAELKKARKNPNILRPGDKVFVPDAPEPEEVEVVTGRLHRFRVEVALARLRVYLKNEEGEPYARKRFEIRMGETIIKGATTDQGLVEVEIPAYQERSTLAAWIFEGEAPAVPDAPPDVEYDLHIGHLDPVESITGAQARLDNLGFRCPVSGVMCEVTLAAISRFRAVYGVEAEGAEPIDDTFRAKLASLHDGE